jgi:hypothetical protein
MPPHILMTRAQWRRSFQTGQWLSPDFRLRRRDGAGCGDNDYGSVARALLLKDLKKRRAGMWQWGPWI